MWQESQRERWFGPGRSGKPLVLIATERVLPEPDPDEDLLLTALDAAGLEPRLAAWDDPDVGWGAARPALYNPAGVLRWNSHKGYLLELARAGVPVVPTVLLPRGASAGLADVMSERGLRRIVVKPAVSASSYRTLAVEGGNLDEGEAHLRDLLAERDALVQPYVQSVEDYGERAVIWIDGEFTHAVRKAPRFADNEESVSGALPPVDDELEVARAALAAVS